MIGVEDIDAAIRRVSTAGGTVHGAPMTIPGVGRYVAITDTEGNAAAMLEPAGQGADPQGANPIG